MRTYKKTVLFLSICLYLFSSCTNEREVVTDIYFIHNDLEQPVTLVFSNPVPWDTCLSGDFVRVMYDSICPNLPAQKTIRLHPVLRKYKKPENHDYQINPGYIFGGITKLIVNTDTIIWQSKYGKYGHMFSTDSIWSIYNYENWQTVQAEDMPYTFYSTFTITPSHVERSLP